VIADLWGNSEKEFIKKVSEKVYYRKT